MKLNTIIICLLILIIVSCKKSPSYEDIQEFRLAYVMSSGGLLHEGAERFAKRVFQKTNGEVKVNLYPSGQLGNEV